MRGGLVVLLVLLAGCVATGTRVDEAQLVAFEKGRTTYFEVVAALGKPNAMTLHADGSRQVVYTYTQSQIHWQSYVPILAAFAQGATAETSTVTFAFDTQNVLVEYTAQQGQTAVGTGFNSGARQ